MEPIKVSGALVLPNSLDNTQREPTFPGTRFDLSAAGVQRNVHEGSTEIALALWRTESTDTFACLYLDVPSARALAEKLVEATSSD